MIRCGNDLQKDWDRQNGKNFLFQILFFGPEWSDGIYCLDTFAIYCVINNMLFCYVVLQVALSKQGYHCGDDEMRWWQFGSSTVDALKTFQVRGFYTS
jgi:hypothetical protein